MVEIIEIVTSDYTKVEREHYDIFRKVQDAISDGKASITVLNDNKIFSNRKLNIISNRFSDMMTQNYVGVLYFKNEHTEAKISILSRFDKDDKDKGQQQFLKYMLEKVGEQHINLLKTVDAFVGKDTNLKDLFYIRFIELLQKAHNKGYYRKYQKQQYNDSKPKGSININRYVKNLGLKNGKIPYDVRERVLANPINILLLKAYEKMLKEGNGDIKQILELSPSIRKYMQQLKYEVPEFANYDVHKLLKETSNAIAHPYYALTEELRRVARDILMNKGIELFSNENVNVHGILINVNSLWEKFVTNMLRSSKYISEYDVKSQDKRDVLQNSLSNPLTAITPDIVLYKNELPLVVLDAKHKLKWQESVVNDEKNNAFRDDIFQIVSYMNFLNCSIGGVIFPYSKDEEIILDNLEGRSLSQLEQRKFLLTIPLNIKRKGKHFNEEMDRECALVTERLESEIQKMLQKK